MPESKTQNTFKYEPVDMRKPNLWMHSVERQDTNNAGNLFYSLAIGLATLLLMAGILYAIGEYPKAYPPQSVTVNK